MGTLASFPAISSVHTWRRSVSSCVKMGAGGGGGGAGGERAPSDASGVRGQQIQEGYNRP